ncbi:MAG: inositol-3-phosphate synthase [Phycisphaerae bacterium]|nr:inositol-3-phosphate synthase [Phycisphaerae bacterium]
MDKIRIAIAGMGNCASSLLQGIEHYRRAAGADHTGLMHFDVGGYTPADIELVAAFDIDRRKVGQPASAAIFAPPNNTMRICNTFASAGPVVQMGPVLDGIAEHMKNYPAERTFVPSDEKPVDVAAALRRSKAEILLIYLPVGSQKAAEYYAEAALEAGVGLINCIPVFIVSDPRWAARFKAKNLPCIGDDIKAQVGATITHRVLTRLFEERGVKLTSTYQLNTGGNTDFLNMLERSRLASKKISKTEAVQSQLKTPLPEEQIHIGPSDYVPWQKDNKVCFIRMEGQGFAGVPLNLELRLSVEDSPNSAGVAIDAIRFCKLAKTAKMSGPFLTVSAYLMKHPPKQMRDEAARAQIEAFLEGFNEEDEVVIDYANPETARLETMGV